MAIIQVTRTGSTFAVLEDGVVIPGSRFPTRGEAVRFAIQHKEAA